MNLLDRIQDTKTGRLHDKYHVTIPPDRYAQHVEISNMINLKEDFPLLKDVDMMTESNALDQHLA